MNRENKNENNGKDIVIIYHLDGYFLRIYGVNQVAMEANQLTYLPIA
jgi:hypothetical protein